MVNCPKCKSSQAQRIDHNYLSFLRCLQCGYNELAAEDTFPEQRSNQREKRRYSPYRVSGGKKR
ncbi:TPA: hypothetical protein HA241_06150 [Candidatus Woesearchaeota archaeon]|nr:hypothetical protein [Candidatus Woesearchaeota archaeon]